jgi:hypothetical protein
MTENQLMARIDDCKRPADFERLLYDQAEGRMSRSEAKMVIGRLTDLARAERRQDSKNLLLDMLNVKRNFFGVIAN